VSDRDICAYIRSPIHRFGWYPLCKLTKTETGLVPLLRDGGGVATATTTT